VLTSLDLSTNDLGGRVLPEGWKSLDDDDEPPWLRIEDDHEQEAHPGGPEGIIALASAIPGMMALTKFDISNNAMGSEGGKALAAGLKGNHVITELSIARTELASNHAGGCDMSGVIAVADAIIDMEALLVLNLANNDIGQLVKGPLPGGWKSQDDYPCTNDRGPWLRIEDGNEQHEYQPGHEQDEYPGKETLEGVIVLSNAIKDLKALTSLNISDNNLGGISDWMKPPRQGLKVGDLVDAKPVVQIHNTPRYYEYRDKQEEVYDIKVRDLSGAIALAGSIGANEALSVANVMGNFFGKEYLTKLQDTMHSKPNLVSLCGIPDGAEANLSCCRISGDDAFFLASELLDNRTLTKLDISNNDLYSAGTKALAEGLKSNQIMTELNVSSNSMRGPGAIALADIIPGMGSILSVNILMNNIGTDEAEALASILEGHPTLKTLCGLKGNEIELNMSNKMKGAADAIMLAAEIINTDSDYYWQLTSLNLSSNDLFAEGAQIIAEAIKVT
jgi:Ran GTPase-activating protein (RanGAP) involved in mRNA processing and transport